MNNPMETSFVATKIDIDKSCQSNNLLPDEYDISRLLLQLLSDVLGPVLRHSRIQQLACLTNWDGSAGKQGGHDLVD